MGAGPPKDIHDPVTLLAERHRCSRRVGQPVVGWTAPWLMIWLMPCAVSAWGSIGRGGGGRRLALGFWWLCARSPATNPHQATPMRRLGMLWSLSSRSFGVIHRRTDSWRIIVAPYCSVLARLLRSISVVTGGLTPGVWACRDLFTRAHARAGIPSAEVWFHPRMAKKAFLSQNQWQRQASWRRLGLRFELLPTHTGCPG